MCVTPLTPVCFCNSVLDSFVSLIAFEFIRNGTLVALFNPAHCDGALCTLPKVCEPCSATCSHASNPKSCQICLNLCGSKPLSRIPDGESCELNYFSPHSPFVFICFLVQEIGFLHGPSCLPQYMSI